MMLVPVIDIQGGRVVHARGGVRSHYQPAAGASHPGSDPAGWAALLAASVGHPEAYIADLDAIVSQRPNFAILGEITRAGGRVSLDPGIRQAAEIGPWLALGVSRIVLGTETLQGPEVVREAVERHGPAMLALGLDLRSGQAVIAPGSDRAWSPGRVTATEIVEQARAAGIERFVVLDWTEIGNQQGLARWAVPCLKPWLDRWPDLEFWAGGGFASTTELPELAEAGIAAVLVGSALIEKQINLPLIGSIHMPM